MTSVISPTINQTADQFAREQALDPSRSFIIQAPAGSGKTELLSQRFLVLLTQVTAPEEIVAITFTKKAAAEMRERILQALINADAGIPASEEHRIKTYQLAKNVLARDQQLNWNLRNNPNRLRILTIDALCAHICAQIPVLARLGGAADIVENATSYYQQAIKRLLLEAETNNELVDHLEILLFHLNNRLFDLENLFLSLLKKRDQWLPHIVSNVTARQQMELSLKHVVIEKMFRAKQLLAELNLEELPQLARLAGEFIKYNKPENVISHCAEITALPEVSVECLPQWLGLAGLLLTKEAEWRKSINVNCGFPPNSPHKKSMENLLKSLQDREMLRQALAELTLCPALTYNDQQWQIVQSLIYILPRLTAHLHLLFQENSVIDFIELNLSALHALGDEESPSQLALKLDYQIKHLLIDEFQDTSLTQFRLFEKIVSAWSPQEHRTVFLVGDPMQSIYRFRNAEVGLFLRTKQRGIANLKLEFLNLYLNFRSQEHIVSWINQCFKKIFPINPDIESGAIPYAESVATKISHDDNKIFSYPVNNDEQESEKIVHIINECRSKNENCTIAILVQSRTHLKSIISRLNNQKINYQAVDISPLQDQLEIRDLMSLTRALLHRGDRIAWMSILRAPWCGLILKDLLIISQAAENKTIYEVLLGYQSLTELSLEAQQRLAKFVPTISQSIGHYGRLPPSQWLRGTWLALGGPAILDDHLQLANCESFFNLLQTIESSRESSLIQNIEIGLLKLYAKVNPKGDSRLQIMTIHKAKGLEFDHVIIPGLAKKMPNEKNQLLLWLERPSLLGSADLMLAPIKAYHQQTDSIYAYLKRVEKNKLNFESARLLYVATTRAKKSLYLLACVEYDEGNAQLKPPHQNTFAMLLWPMINNELLHRYKELTKATAQESIFRNHNIIKRLKPSWTLPFLANGHDPQMRELFVHTNNNNLPTESLSNHVNRAIGTVIHEILNQISKLGLQNYRNDKLSAARFSWKMRLAELGVAKNELEDSIDIIFNAVKLTLTDERGQWILSDEHSDAHSEYAINAIIDNKIVHVIIDRCFIDKNNIRWIIDYKTSLPADNSDMQVFYQQEQLNYFQQLQQYASIFQHEQIPIKLGLYFPLCGGWFEWDYKNG